MGFFMGCIESPSFKHLLDYNICISGKFIVNYNCYIFCLEAPSPDEIEAYVVLQECLEMRKRYVFREAVAPWDKEVISDPSTPKPNPDPFLYIPEGKSDVSFFLPPLKTWISLCYML